LLLSMLPSPRSVSPKPIRRVDILPTSSMKFDRCIREWSFVA
jgi:hypothetical protein